MKKLIFLILVAAMLLAVAVPMFAAGPYVPSRNGYHRVMPPRDGDIAPAPMPMKIFFGKRVDLSLPSRW